MDENLHYGEEPQKASGPIRLPYVALPYQRKLGSDSHRFLVIVASRRVGKTMYSINRLLKWALTRDVPPGIEFWYVAPYFYQARTIAWSLLLRCVPKELWARKPNESTLTLSLTNGINIVLKGADNPYGLEGVALGGLIVDEVSAITQWTQLWSYTLRPMLSDYESPAVFISKPRGFNHFHDLAKMGDHNNIIEGAPSEGIMLDEDYITYRFETEINCKEHNGGYIGHDEIAAAKRSMPSAAFDQEYLGKFTKYTGLVHKEFDRMLHIIPNMELPKEWRRVRGWDFGSTHPSASIRIAIDPDDNWFVERCYKEADKHIGEIAETIKEEDKEWLNLDGADTIPGFGDPSGKMWIKELNAKKLSIRRAIKSENTSEKSWLQLGIDKINEKLKPDERHIVFLPDEEGTKIENAPKFFILDRPENFKLVAELETLAYKETQAGINQAEIDDTRDKAGHYDLEASLRYFAVSYGRKLAFGNLDSPSQNAAVQRAVIDVQKTQHVYVPATIDMNDPAQREEFERKADLEAIKSQMNGW